MSDCELAWAAGVFEATGTATLSSRPMLNIKQSSSDGSVTPMVARFYEAIGRRGRIGGPYSEKTSDKVNRRPFRMWYAESEDAQAVMELLRPWLSSTKLDQWLAVRERAQG